MQQEITDLDFDTYFDVTSNSIQGTQQQQQQIIYTPNHDSTQQPIHPTQNLNVPRYPSQHEQYFVPHQPPRTQPEQRPYEMLNWCLKGQQNSNQLSNLDSHIPVTAPGNFNASPNVHNSSSRPDYFQSMATQANSACTTPISPEFDMNQQQCRPSIIVKQEGMQYGYQNNAMMDNSNQNMTYQLSRENNNASAGSRNSVAHSSQANLPTPMSDIMFPETPQSRTSIKSAISNSSNSTGSESPTPERPAPLINAFSAIEQWRKNNDDEAIPDCAHEDYHETRHWRKTNRSDSTTSHTTSLVAAAMAAVTARRTPRTPIETGRQLKKVAHNAIERRYRNNINDRIQDLKNVVPALYRAKNRDKKSKNGSSNDEYESSDDDHHDSVGDGEIVEGVEVAKKLNKATILHKATEYIHHLKHTNELAERENQVLQQILAQMPGGAKVLARFQVQKYDSQQAEQQRLLVERKEALERERNERQRMLRERAAQRAALAELLPKQERRPYRRRAKTQQTEGQDVPNSDASTTTGRSLSVVSLEKDIKSEDNNVTVTVSNNSNNKTFMALFLCLAVASPSSFGKNETGSRSSARVISHPQQMLAQSTCITSFDYWYWSKVILFIALSMYFLVRYLYGKAPTKRA